MTIYVIRLLLKVFVTLQLDVRVLKTMTHQLSCGPSKALGFINKNSCKNKTKKKKLLFPVLEHTNFTAINLRHVPIKMFPSPSTLRPIPIHGRHDSLCCFTSIIYGHF